VHDERLLGAEFPQGLGHRPHVVAAEDADELALGPGRVGQRPEQVKNCPERQLGPHGHDVPHRRVVGAGEHKAYAHLLYAPADLFGF
jgi:hypothetical protein